MLYTRVFFIYFFFFGQSRFPQLAKLPQAVVVLNKCQWLSADALKKGAFPTEWSLREIKEKKKQNQAPWIAFSREISGRSNSDHSPRIRLFERLHNLCTPSQGCQPSGFHSYHVCKAAAFQSYQGAGEWETGMRQAKTHHQLIVPTEFQLLFLTRTVLVLKFLQTFG